jgi:hypothetical protein
LGIILWKTGKRLSDYVGILFSGATCAISLGQVYGFLGKLINSKVFNIATKELIIMSKKFGKTWMFIAWLALAVFIYYNALILNKIKSLIIFVCYLKIIKNT